MNVNDAFPSKYLRASDLQNREHTLTISNIVMEEMNGDRGKQSKPVAFFQGAQKGLVLNKTNSLTIAAAYGDEMTAWFGRQIVLFPAMDRMAGEMKPCIRVRPVFSGAASAPAAAQARPLGAPVQDRDPPPPAGGWANPHNAGPLPPPTQPMPQQRGGDLNDPIPFAPEWRV